MCECNLCHDFPVERIRKMHSRTSIPSWWGYFMVQENRTSFKRLNRTNWRILWTRIAPILSKRYIWFFLEILNIFEESFDNRRPGFKEVKHFAAWILLQFDFSSKFKIFLRRILIIRSLALWSLNISLPQFCSNSFETMNSIVSWNFKYFWGDFWQSEAWLNGGQTFCRLT